jgi:nitroimidazol reductase NimA-like FMN-containing flavoprotein (pyridoxamine 5'-phosphate oxidase superfamily)
MHVQFTRSCLLEPHKAHETVIRPRVNLLAEPAEPAYRCSFAHSHLAEGFRSSFKGFSRPWHAPMERRARVQAQIRNRTTKYVDETRVDTANKAEFHACPRFLQGGTVGVLATGGCYPRRPG